MGVNLTWVCKTHKLHHTSLRGEEGLDFQAMIRGDHGPCFRNGNITAWHDGYFIDDSYKEMFPNWNDRPAERMKNGLDPY